MAETGRFITFEGGEGTGKSTLIASIARHVATSGVQIVTTREPGGTPLAEHARRLLLDPPGEDNWSPLAQALLVNAARRDHIERLIIPSLAEGAWVLCDRFADSTRAYQGAGGVSKDILQQLEAVTVGDTQPDLTFILDAPPQDLAERRRLRGTVDLFEKAPLAFHEKIRTEFLEIAEHAPDRCVVLNALESADMVLDKAISVLETRFG